VDLVSATFILAALAGGGSIYFVYKLDQWIHHKTEAARRLWKLLAERLDGRVEGSSSSGSGISVVANIDGVNVTVMAERAALREGRAPIQVTTISAGAEETGGLELHVFPEDAIAQMNKALGGQDIIVGEQDFDERFVVKASNEDLARAWLDEETRRGIEACHPYHLSLSRGEARATRAGLEQDVRLLEMTARNIALFAQGGQRLLAATKAAAIELGGLFSATSQPWAADGGVLIVLERLKTRVLIDFIRRPTEAGPERVFTRARARALLPLGARFVLRGRGGCPPPKELGAMPPLKLVERAFPSHLDVFGDDIDAIEARLTDAVAARLEGLRPELVALDGQEVTVCLMGLILDVAVLERAIELTLELGRAEPSRPYR
jgi:hypothetical protein